MRPLALNRTFLVMAGFLGALVCNALGAYSLSGIPLPWIGQATITAAALVALLSGRVQRVPGSGGLFLYFAWAVACTAVNAAVTDYSLLMPPLATTPYPIFLLLRFFNLVAFGAALYVTLWLLRRGREEQLTRTLVAVGTGVALVAIYIYLAQIYGLPELPRNRMGTSGGAQITKFAYAFHRAMGTFREPGPLAAWLVVPIMLAFARGWVVRNVPALLMSVALFLTGSLAGIPAAGIGILGAILVSGPLRPARIRLLLGVGIVVALALTGFRLLTVEDTSLFSVLGARMGNMLEKGMEGSSRIDIYRALDSMPPEVVGVGLGHANLLLTRAAGDDVVTSFLSLYLATLYSLGILGLLLLLWFLSVPLLLAIRHWCRLNTDPVAFWSLAGYLAWLVMFAFRSDELPFMFAVVTALLLNSLRPQGPVTHAPRTVDVR